MKKLLTFLIVMIFGLVGLLAQNPTLSYQSVVRDENNRLVQNTSINLTVQIFEGDVQKYQETRTVTTNQNGVVSFAIGDANRLTNEEELTNIVSWNGATIKVTYHLTSGDVVLDNPVTAVPYALQAGNAQTTESDPVFTAWDKDYNDLINTPEIPTVNNATLTIKQGENTLGTFTANASEAVNVSIPEPADQVQANWDEENEESSAFIQNKPEIPIVNNATLTIKQGETTLGTFTANADEDIELSVTEQVNADWNENDAAATAYIQNRPTLAPVALTGDYNFLTNTPDLSGYAVADEVADQYVAKAGSNTITATNSFSGNNNFTATVTVPQAVNQTDLSYTNDEMQAVSYKDLKFIFDTLQKQIAELQATVAEQQSAIEELQAYAEAAVNHSAPEFIGLTHSSTCDGDLTLNAQFNSPATEITGYEFAYSTNSDMSEATTQSTVDATYTFTGLTPGTQYYVTVKATNENGSTTSDIQSIDFSSTSISVDITYRDCEYFITTNATSSCGDLTYTYNIASDSQMQNILSSSTTNSNVSSWWASNYPNFPLYVQVKAQNENEEILSDIISVERIWIDLDTVITCNSIVLSNKNVFSIDGEIHCDIELYRADNPYESLDSRYNINLLDDTITFDNLVSNTTYRVYYPTCQDENEFYFTTNSSDVTFNRWDISTTCNSITVTPHFNTELTDVQYHYMLLDNDSPYPYEENTTTDESYTFSNVDLNYTSYKIRVELLLPDGCSIPSRDTTILAGSAHFASSIIVKSNHCGVLDLGTEILCNGTYDYKWEIFSDSEHNTLIDQQAENYAEFYGYNGPDSLFYHKTGLEPNSTYYVKLTLTDNYSGSSYSDEIEVTTENFVPSITYNDLDAHLLNCSSIYINPDFSGEDAIQYNYKVDYHYDEWSDWENIKSITTTDNTYTYDIDNYTFDPYSPTEFRVEVTATSMSDPEACPAYSEQIIIAKPDISGSLSVVPQANCIILNYTLTNTELPTKFMWDNASCYNDEDSYWLSWNDDATKNGNVYTLVFDGLTSGETYYIEASVATNCGESESYIYDQYTTLTVAGAPVYVSHSATSSYDGTSIDLSSTFGDNLDEITEYKFFVGTTDNIEEATVIDNLTEGTATFATSINTAYYVWASAINGVGQTYSTGYQTVTTYGGEPIYIDHNLSSAQLGTSITVTANFDEGGAEITNYSFKIGTTDNMSAAETIDNGTNPTIEYATDLNTTYYVWVTATNAIGETTSPVKTITTPGAPSLTNIVVDSTNANGTILKITANFNNNRSTITDYTFYIGTTEVFEEAVAISNGTNRIYNYTSIPGTTYFVWVSATNALGTTITPTYKTGTVRGYAVIENVSAMLSSANSATLSAEITSDGGATITERGFCWSHSPEPSLEGYHVAISGKIGEFSTELTNLTMGGLYYVRAYAINSVGTVYSDLSFQVGTGSVPQAVLPTITISMENAIINISLPEFSGTITSDGGADITSCGFCWSTSTNPTIEDNHSVADATQNFTFTKKDFPGMETNTLYYVRAYATNEIGTAYSDVISFETPEWFCGIKIKDHEDNEYGTVLIGNQCWMSESMRCVTSPSTGTNLLVVDANGATPNRSGVSKGAGYPNNDVSNVPTYGIMYNWCAAVDTFQTKEILNDNADDWRAFSPTLREPRRGVCPQGWHIPSSRETETLVNYVLSQNNNNNTQAAKALASTSGWNGQQGTNTTGFNAYPAGGLYSYAAHFGQWAAFWTITNQSSWGGSNYVYLLNITGYSGPSNVSPTHTDGHKWYGRQVRCVKDN